MRPLFFSENAPERSKNGPFSIAKTTVRGNKRRPQNLDIKVYYGEKSL